MERELLHIFVLLERDSEKEREKYKERERKMERQIERQRDTYVQRETYGDRGEESEREREQQGRHNLSVYTAWVASALKPAFQPAPASRVWF